MRNKICENCKWLDLEIASDMKGKCRRFPPFQIYGVHAKIEDIEFDVVDIADGLWLDVYTDDWCGEFKEKQNE